MIDDIIEDFEEYRKSMEEYEEEEQQQEDFPQEEESEEEKELSELSVKELQKLMDDALDSGNMDEVERIGNELSNR
jgi:esterase/lipase